MFKVMYEVFPGAEGIVYAVAGICMREGVFFAVKYSAVIKKPHLTHVYIGMLRYGIVHDRTVIFRKAQFKALFL